MVDDKKEQKRKYARTVQLAPYKIILKEGANNNILQKKINKFKKEHEQELQQILKEAEDMRVILNKKIADIFLLQDLKMKLIKEVNEIRVEYRRIKKEKIAQARQYIKQGIKKKV